jgi:hypothetical protein
MQDHGFDAETANALHGSGNGEPTNPAPVSADREAPRDGIERARAFYVHSEDDLLGEFDCVEQLRVGLAWMDAYAASEVSRVEAKIERIELSLLELTPSGSEFVNDPERCLEFIKARLSQSVRFAGERNEARKQAEDAKAEVSRVRRETLALLQKHEWDGGRLGVGQCPICSYEAYSHLKNCWLAAAIRKLMDEVG